MTKINLDELQKYINISASHAGEQGIDAGTIMVQQMLNQVVRDTLRDAGFAVTDQFNPLTYCRDGIPSDTGQRPAGSYTQTGHTISIDGPYTVNATAALLTTVHETMHMIQHFVMSNQYDQTIAGDYKVIPHAEKPPVKTDNLTQSVYKTSQTDPTIYFHVACARFFGMDNVDILKSYVDKFYGFLQQTPFFGKGEISILADDHRFYSSGTAYSGNSTEWQANVFAMYVVPKMLDPQQIHDMDKNVLAKWSKHTQEQLSCDQDMKQSPKYKKTQLRESGSTSRVFYAAPEKEFLKPKDTASIKETVREQLGTVRFIDLEIESIKSVEELEREELFAQRESQSKEDILRIVDSCGFHILPHDIDMTHIQGGIYTSYESYSSLFNTLEAQFTRMDEGMRDRIYVDLENKHIIIDGAQEVLHAVREMYQQDRNMTPDLDLVEQGNKIGISLLSDDAIAASTEDEVSIGDLL